MDRKGKLRILYVTMDPLETNTSANIRNRGLVMGLVSLGHKVDTLSMEPDCKSIAFDSSLCISELTDTRYYFKPDALYRKMRTKKPTETLYDVQNKSGKASALKAGKKKLLQSIKFILNNISAYDLQRFNVRNVRLVKLNLSHYDAIISSSDPKSSHLIAEHLISNRNKKPIWIQYWGDPFLGDITGSQSKWEHYLRKKAENILLKKADKVVYTSLFTLNMQKSLYPEQKQKMIYAVQAAIWKDAVIEKKEKGEITLGYFGNYHSKVRNIQPLFEAVSGREECLVVCGNGDVEADNVNISLHSRMTYEKSVELENQMDVLVCLCNKSGTQIPGKIYYAAGYPKPIILILDGEQKQQIRQFFEKFNRYILCDNRKEAIIEAVEQAKLEIKEGRKYQIPKEMQPEYVAETVLENIKRRD